jgi:ribosomal protein uL24
MSCHVNKELKTKYEIRSVPVRKGDTVKVMRGIFKGREGKVATVYRKKWAIHVEKITKEKTNGNISFLYLIYLDRFINLDPSSPFKLIDNIIEA